MTTTKFHKVLAERANPLHDRRCKYGLKSKAFIRPGSLVRENIFYNEVSGHVVPTSYFTIDNEYITRSLFESLQTEVHELDPIETFNVHYSGYRHDDMIREFLANGLLNIEDIREYFERPE